MFVIARYVKQAYVTMPSVNRLQILERFDSRDGFVDPIWSDAGHESMIVLVHKIAPKTRLSYWKDSRNFGKQFADAFIMHLEDAMNIENLNNGIKYDKYNYNRY